MTGNSFPQITPQLEITFSLIFDLKLPQALEAHFIGLDNLNLIVCI